MKPERELAALRAPDELGARARAWEVVRAAHRDLPPDAPDQRPHRPPRLRALALVPALCAVVAALTLTPAGATVTRLIGHALSAPPRATTSLLTLPSSGHLLVTDAGGIFIVAANGARTRLGAWRQASWSPHGRYVAVVGGGRLAAIDPRGRIQWSLLRPAASDPRWYGPSGYRVAYLSAQTLRVVAGDGTGDHLLAAPVLPVAPAWRPNHPYQVTYAVPGRIVTRDGDTGALVWTARARGVRELQWSAAGDRLLVLTAAGVSVLDDRGATIATIAGPVLDAALSPDGRQVALVRGGSDRDVAIVGLQDASGRRTLPAPAIRSVLSAPGTDQVAWSPDGRWLLVSWPAADQWVFLAAAAPPRIVSVSRIARQFRAGPHAAPAFPKLDGWCCVDGDR